MCGVHVGACMDVSDNIYFQIDRHPRPAILSTKRPRRLEGTCDEHAAGGKCTDIHGGELQPQSVGQGGWVHPSVGHRPPLGVCNLVVEILQMTCVCVCASVCDLWGRSCLAQLYKLALKWSAPTLGKR